MCAEQNGHGTRRWRDVLGGRRVRLALAGLLVPVLAGLLLYAATWFIPLPPALLHPPEESLVLEDREGRELAVLPGRRARSSEAARLDEMGAWLPRVTVALEDRRFLEHSGVDFRSVAASAWRNVRHGRVVSGGATIAQQLIKNTRGRSGWRWWDKAYEALAAVRLCREWDRNRILEEYLNRIDYGNRRQGPRAAARAYFSKEPADLTLPEAIFLAGLPQSPTRYNPWRHPEAAAERYRRSLRVLRAQGLLSDAILLALADETPPVLRNTPPNAAPHFVNAVAALRPGGRGRLRTTLDLPLQRQVDTLVRTHLSRLAGRGVSQAAAVVLDNRDGAVLAMVGSADYFAPEGEINGALLPRSSGSVLKPFLYLEAIQQRLLTAASALPDTPDAIRSEYIDYDPRNFDERYRGPVRLREALACSLNVPAVWTLGRVGARRFYERLQDWGFRFPRDLRDYGAGIILGNAEPRLTDLAAAFSGIANRGQVPAWRLLAGEPRLGRRVADPAAASIIADILCDDDARRGAFGRASVLATPVRVPCKTGTSSGFHDAWTVGSTAEHTVAVWAGNFDGKPMDGTASIEAAAPLWRAIIDVLLAHDTGVPAPRVEDGLSTREVCRLSGLLPVPASPGVLSEWFLPGTEPSANAGAWLQGTPEVPVLVLPSEYALWCSGTHNIHGARVASVSKVRILSPAPGAVYLMDAALAPSQQQLALELEASAADRASARWTVDGQPVPRVDGRHLWSLTPGDKVAEVECGGTRSQVRFSVRLPSR